jgi:hypothetical protein
MESYTQEKESKYSKIKTDMDAELDPYLDRLIEQTKENTKYIEPDWTELWENSKLNW